MTVEIEYVVPVEWSRFPLRRAKQVMDAKLDFVRQNGKPDRLYGVWERGGVRVLGVWNDIDSYSEHVMVAGLHTDGASI